MDRHKSKNNILGSEVNLLPSFLTPKRNQWARINVTFAIFRETDFGDIFSSAINALIPKYLKISCHHSVFV